MKLWIATPISSARNDGREGILDSRFHGNDGESYMYDERNEFPHSLTYAFPTETCRTGMTEEWIASLRSQ
jgi:hypothetical protein